MLALLKVAQEKMQVMSASPRTALLYVAGYVPSQPGLPLYGYLVINVYVILNNAVVTGTLLTLLTLLALVWDNDCNLCVTCYHAKRTVLQSQRHLPTPEISVATLESRHPWSCQMRVNPRTGSPLFCWLSIAPQCLFARLTSGDLRPLGRGADEPSWSLLEPYCVAIRIFVFPP